MMEKFLFSVKTSTGLWSGLWVMLVLNMAAIAVLLGGFSWTLAVISILLLAAGVAALQGLGRISLEEPAIDVDVQEQLEQLMDEIRPQCEEIFAAQLKRALEPVEQEFERELSKGLDWLWEEVDDFYRQAEQGAQEARPIFQLFSQMQEDKIKLVQRLQEDAQAILSIIQEIHERRQQEQADIRKWMQEKYNDLHNGMVREKEYFYDYVYKVLAEQVRVQEKDTETTESLHPVWLGQQFAVAVESSLARRVTAFHNTLLLDLENFSAEAVGRLQHATGQLMNHFRAMEELLEQLLRASQNNSGVLVKRLEGYLALVRRLEERSAEIMVTLAWQDVMVEKRWDEIQAQLFKVKDKIIENAEAGVMEYIEGALEKSVPGLSAMTRDADNAVFYKALLDAELIYQVYAGNNASALLDDGAYSLLQFVRPIELLTSRTIRLSDEGLRRLRSWKPMIKKGQHQPLFERVCLAVENCEPEAAGRLAGIFPRHFYQFASSPYLKNKPANLSQAGWAVFTGIIDNEHLPEEAYLLCGLLLAVHQIRNGCIQPFNSVPAALENPQDVELMRTASYRIVSILLQQNLSGIARIGMPAGK